MRPFFVYIWGMISPDTIVLNSQGLVTFSQNGFPVASCKSNAVLSPIIQNPQSQNYRGFRVYTGASGIEGVKPELYQYIDFDINNLTSVVNIATAYTFTPPASIPALSNTTSNRSVFLAVYNRLTSSIFKACCATEVTVVGDGILFFDTYADLPATGLVDVEYVTRDGSGAFYWNTTTLGYEPIFYPHATLTTFAYQTFT